MTELQSPRAGYAYRLHFNEGPFGSGWREVIVGSVGRKWVTIVDPTRLDVARVALAEWTSFEPERRQGYLMTTGETDGPPGNAMRLRRRARFLTRLGVPFPATKIKKIAASLEKETSDD